MFREELRAEVVTLMLVAISLVLLMLPDGGQRTIARHANHVLMLPVSHIRSSFSGYLGLREENAALREELQRARLLLSSTRAERLQNEELQRLLMFTDEQPVRMLPARVTDRNFNTLPTTFQLDRGKIDGVEPDVPVVTVDGLVGKIVGVGPRTSQVYLYSHPDFSASALLVGGDHLEYGIARPASSGELQLFLPLRSRSEPGDRIVTSGYGGTFPRGIPIGSVEGIREDQRLHLQRIDLIDPAVDLGGVTAVLVLMREKTTEGSTDGSAGGSAGGMTRLFWPGYAYPPMRGELLGRSGVDSTPADSVSADSVSADSVPADSTAARIP